MIKDNVMKRKTNPNNKAYMNSYDWNYMVLDLVDYIEERLSSKINGDDEWKYFKDYCSLKYLNWRVIKKMIEYSVVQVFNSEADLIKCETFKPLDLKNDSDNEMKTTGSAPKKKVDEFNFDFDEPLLKDAPKKETELFNPFEDEGITTNNNEKTSDIIF